MAKRVLITMDPEADVRRLIQDRLGRLAQVSYLPEAAGEDRARAIQDADAVVFFQFGKELSLEERSLLASVDLVQSIPAGVDTLPLDELPPEPTVCANSGGWSSPFGEYALGLMLALGKEFVSHSKKLAEGVYVRSNIQYFRGQTAGIVGFGGIGQEVARALSGIGMGIMAINSRGRTDQPVDFIGTLDDLEKVLRKSHAVVLSIPLTSANHGLIGARELGWMREDAILINLARGPVVDEEALYQRLKDFPEFKFGADVWWREPLTGHDYSLNHPFFEFPNFLGTPHNADLVEGIMIEAVGSAVDNVARFLEDRPLKGVVNREDYF